MPNAIPITKPIAIKPKPAVMRAEQSRHLNNRQTAVHTKTIMDRVPAIPEGTLPVLLDALRQIGDAHHMAAAITQQEAAAMEKALGVVIPIMWPNAEEAVASIDYVRRQLAAVLDPMACALCCVSAALRADMCEA